MKITLPECNQQTGDQPNTGRTIMKEATEIPCITTEEANRRHDALRASISDLGLTQDAGFTIFYVFEEVKLPDGSTVVGCAISPAFETKEPAEEARAALLTKHPGAIVCLFCALAQGGES